jgi:hypothetical protein
MKNKKIIVWLVWLFLVVVWNFGYPLASPLKDVLVAVFLSLLAIYLQKKKI